VILVAATQAVDLPATWLANSLLGENTSGSRQAYGLRRRVSLFGLTKKEAQVSWQFAPGEEILRTWSVQDLHEAMVTKAEVLQGDQLLLALWCVGVEVRLAGLE
jgi:hypothetical protein